MAPTPSPAWRAMSPRVYRYSRRLHRPHTSAQSTALCWSACRPVQNATLFPQLFPMFCPEPALAKRSFYIHQLLERGVFRTPSPGVSVPPPQLLLRLAGALQLRPRSRDDTTKISVDSPSWRPGPAKSTNTSRVSRSYTGVTSQTAGRKRISF